MPAIRSRSRGATTSKEPTSSPSSTSPPRRTSAKPSSTWSRRWRAKSSSRSPSEAGSASSGTSGGSSTRARTRSPSIPRRSPTRASSPTRRARSAPSASWSRWTPGGGMGRGTGEGEERRSRGGRSTPMAAGARPASMRSSGAPGWKPSGPARSSSPAWTGTGPGTASISRSPGRSPARSGSRSSPRGGWQPRPPRGRGHRRAGGCGARGQHLPLRRLHRPGSEGPPRSARHRGAPRPVSRVTPRAAGSPGAFPDIAAPPAPRRAVSVAGAAVATGQRLRWPIGITFSASVRTGSRPAPAVTERSGSSARGPSRDAARRVACSPT